MKIILIKFYHQLNANHNTQKQITKKKNIDKFRSWFYIKTKNKILNFFYYTSICFIQQFISQFWWVCIILWMYRQTQAYYNWGVSITTRKRGFNFKLLFRDFFLYPCWCVLYISIYIFGMPLVQFIHAIQHNVRVISTSHKYIEAFLDLIRTILHPFGFFIFLLVLNALDGPWLVNYNQFIIENYTITPIWYAATLKTRTSHLIVEYGTGVLSSYAHNHLSHPTSFPFFMHIK